VHESVPDRYGQRQTDKLWDKITVADKNTPATQKKEFTAIYWKKQISDKVPLLAE